MSEPTDPTTLAADLTAAWLANPNTRVSSEDVPAFLVSMHRAVTALSAGKAAEPEVTADYKPAVSVRKSLASADHLISMIDGKPYKTLKRHLKRHGLTPDDYRQRYNLKADYPMVAKSYSDARSAMAKTIGLGRKAGTKVKASVTAPPRQRRKRGASKDAPAAGS